MAQRDITPCAINNKASPAASEPCAIALGRSAKMPAMFLMMVMLVENSVARKNIHAKQTRWKTIKMRIIESALMYLNQAA